MSWFFGRRRRRKVPPEEKWAPPGLTSGRHRSPGMALLVQEMVKRRPQAILDLGGSVNENVVFLTRYADNISIQDLFRSSEPAAGTRATAFGFDAEVIETLPSEADTFDAVLVWDLLHYFERRDAPLLAARLGALCRPGALVFLLASATTPIPMIPIRFKIHDEESLHYDVPTREHAPSPHLLTRDVEQLFKGFEPLRNYQLRNGLQETLLRYAPAGDATDAGGPRRR